MADTKKKRKYKIIDMEEMRETLARLTSGELKRSLLTVKERKELKKAAGESVKAELHGE